MNVFIGSSGLPANPRIYPWEATIPSHPMDLSVGKARIYRGKSKDKSVGEKRINPWEKKGFIHRKT